MKDRAKKLLSDSMWSIVGMVTMNMAAQFILYPSWNRVYGSERYGDILFLLSLMNIFAVSAGSSCNYARMRESVRGETRNGPYLMLLSALSALLLPLAALAAKCTGVRSTWQETVCFMLLAAATMWRFYLDVEYRLSLDYRGSFRFYIIISVGYMAGIALLRVTDVWPLALLPGEAAGICYVLARGRVLRPDGRPDREQMRSVTRLFSLLVGADLLSSVIFNGDRILLRTLAGGTAVTIYYLASLLGKTISLITTPLNSVIMGYLARYKGRLTVRMMHLISAGALAAVLVLAAGCTVGSLILIRILYPREFDQVRGYFFQANAAQVTYFLTNVITVVLLRFSKARYQMVINGLYVLSFCAVCIPVTMAWGLPGFCGGLLGINLFRMCVALGLGYRTALRGEKET